MVIGFLTAWEVIPAFLVLVLFGHVRATQIGAFGKITRFNRLTFYLNVQLFQTARVPYQSPFVFGVGEVEGSRLLAPNKIFENDHRYETDSEEDTAPPILFGGYPTSSPQQDF